MKPIDLNIVKNKIPKMQGLEAFKQGGQKVVFLGVHNDYGKVVVKVIAQYNKRIQREIDIAVKCHIPNTAKLFNWGEFNHNGDKVIYIIEEFIEGRNLRDEMDAQGKLPTKQVMTLIETLLETAVALEKIPLVHRDIKPENIMVCSDGEFKLLDFGIARHLAKSSLTPTNAHFGPHTAGYAAPEQFRNLKKEIDIRTDLYAIGIVAYEALAGKHPFANESRDNLDLLHRMETKSPHKLNIEKDIDSKMSEFITTMMSKYSSRRPPTAILAKQWFISILGEMNLN